MHDIVFDHTHLTEEDLAFLSETIWDADNVELNTVGVDIGSSTSHLMFSKVHLQRMATAMSSRFVVVGRRVIWRSPIQITPYVEGNTIDAAALSRFVDTCYQNAGKTPAQIDSGAVILTGEALRRSNARAIADLFADGTGKFVCASAGHHMESMLAAHGSGVVALSKKRDMRILNVDIGGGTTKFALVERGVVKRTASLAVGGRLVVQAEDGTVTRLEEPAQRLAELIGIHISLGEVFAVSDRERLVGAMSDLIIGVIRRAPDSAMRRALWVTESFDPAFEVDGVAFSGGVSEFLFGREEARFDDLGPTLARRLSHSLANHEVSEPILDPGHGIRATAIGASQFTVQVSGNTIYVSNPETLPLRNIPVVAYADPLPDQIDPQMLTKRLTERIAAHDLKEAETDVAVCVRWNGEPRHARIFGLAKAIANALPHTVASGGLLIVLVDGDVGMLLGRVLKTEVAPNCPVVAVDNIELSDLDYVDIGEMIQPTQVVPLTIKSLLF